MLEFEKGAYVHLTYHFVNENGTLTVIRKKMPRPNEEFEQILRKELSHLKDMHASKTDLFVETDDGMCVVPCTILKNVSISIHEV